MNKLRRYPKAIPAKSKSLPLPYAGYHGKAYGNPVKQITFQHVRITGLVPCNEKGCFRIGTTGIRMRVDAIAEIPYKDLLSHMQY